jgi:type II secretory pathway component HofQ
MESVYRSFVIYILLSVSFSSTLAGTVASYDDVVQQGNTALQSGRLDAALGAAEMAIKTDNARWEAYALAGGALMKLKRYEEAADRLTEAIQRAPDAKRPTLRDLRRQSLAAESAIPTVGVSAPAATTTQAEIVLWKTIENSSNSEDFQTYLEQYPHGAFAALAQRHLADIQAWHEREAQRIADAEAAEHRAITAIDFRRANDGSGRVIAQLTDPHTPISVRQDGNKVIVEFASTAVPTNLLRRYDVTDFATPVKTVEVIRASGISRLVITARGRFEQSSKLSDSTYTIEIKPTTAPAAIDSKNP